MQKVMALVGWWGSHQVGDMIQSSTSKSFPEVDP